MLIGYADSQNHLSFSREVAANLAGMALAGWPGVCHRILTARVLMRWAVPPSCRWPSSR